MLNHKDANCSETRLIPNPTGGKMQNKFGKKSFKHFDHLISNLPSEVRLPGIPSGDLNFMLGTNNVGKNCKNVFRHFVSFNLFCLEIVSNSKIMFSF